MLRPPRSGTCAGAHPYLNGLTRERGEEKRVPDPNALQLRKNEALR
jgi:hypothetical protein